MILVLKKYVLYQYLSCWLVQIIKEEASMSTSSLYSFVNTEQKKT